MKLLKKIGVPSLIILFMQLSMYPYALYEFFGFPEERIMCLVFFGIIFLYCLSIKHRYKGMPDELIVIMVLQSVGWFFYYLLFDDTSYFTRIFFIVLTFLALSMLLWKDSLFRYLDVYCKFLTIQGFLGVIAFVLVFIGVLKPLISLMINDGYGAINFYGLTCSNSVYGNFMRIGGYFDEPGALAFWGIFAIIFNKLTVDDRKIELILIISLFFTFSAAYFVILPIYLVCFYSRKTKSMIMMLMVLVPVLYFTSTSLSSNSVFRNLTVDRFSGGQIRSTRYDQADNAKILFLEKPVFGQGGRNLEKTSIGVVSDNPYEILAKDGVVGFIITYLPLFYVLIKYRNKEVLFSCAILFADYLQRPFHINEMHFFMLHMFSLLVVLKYEKRATKRQIHSVLKLNHK